MTTRYVCISLGHVIIIFTQLTVILLNLMRHFYLIVAWRLMHFNMGRRMAAERASASAECKELRATITHLREQNRALRTRLVTLHATIHGMQDGRADSRVEIEERLRKGREAVSDL